MAQEESPLDAFLDTSDIIWKKNPDQNAVYVGGTKKIPLPEKYLLR